MYTLSKKKAWERKVFKEAAALYHDFPHGIVQDFEAPDFVIYLKQQNRILGIEVTRYIRKCLDSAHPKRHEEASFQRIAQNAQKQFMAQYGIPLLLSFLPIPDKVIKMKKPEQKELTNALVKTVSQNIPNKINQVNIIKINQFEHPVLIETISAIKIMRQKKDTLWKFSSADWISGTEQEVQKIIDGKNEKYRDYLAFCHECWLIIVAKQNSLSSTISIENIIDHPFTSRFAQIFFYFQQSKQLNKLKS